MDAWAWEQLTPWLQLRTTMPSAHCYASSTARHVDDHGPRRPPAHNCVASRHALACGDGSPHTSYATPTPSRWHANKSPWSSSSASSATATSASPRSTCKASTAARSSTPSTPAEPRDPRQRRTTRTARNRRPHPPRQLREQCRIGRHRQPGPDGGGVAARERRAWEREAGATGRLRLGVATSGAGRSRNTRSCSRDPSRRSRVSRSRCRAARS